MTNETIRYLVSYLVQNWYEITERDYREVIGFDQDKLEQHIIAFFEELP